MTGYVRDRVTWLAYLMLAFFSYMLATLGPLTPFLRAELGLNYTVTAFHLSAMALGMMLAGLTGERVIHRWGRPAVFWGSGAGMAIGAIFMIVGRAAPVTIAGSLMMGLLGSYIAVVVQAMFTDRYGDLRSIALTESNVAASVSAFCAPILVGLGESTGLSWRLALVAGAVFWLALVLVYRKAKFPPARETVVTQERRPLPRRFWAFWLVILFSVAIEWCMQFWGADFLQNRVGLERVTAVTLMSLFFLAMIIGRVIGSGLARSVEASRLLLGAIAIVIIGFPLFWLAQTPVLNVAGLFLCGLGIANLFPLTASVATGIDAAQSSLASSRISLASGTAILVAPQVLASLADQTGIYNAFGVAGVLLVATLLIVVAARRMPNSVNVSA